MCVESTAIILKHLGHLVSQVLTQSELQRGYSLLRNSDRDDFFASHLAIRACALAYMKDRRLGDLIVDQRCPSCHADHGKPSLRGAPNMHLSWSHSSGWIGAAASDRASVGIDIQGRASRQGIVWDALTPAERAQVRSAQNPSIEFLRHWVIKESLVKIGVMTLDELPLSAVRWPRGWIPHAIPVNGDAVCAAVARERFWYRLRLGSVAEFDQGVRRGQGFRFSSPEV